MCQEAAGPWVTGSGWHQLTTRRWLRGEHQSLSELSPGYASSPLWGHVDMSPAGLLSFLERIQAVFRNALSCQLTTHTPLEGGRSFVSEALAEHWPRLTASGPSLSPELGDSVLQAAWPGLSCWPPAGYRAEPLTQRQSHTRPITLV